MKPPIPAEFPYKHLRLTPEADLVGMIGVGSTRWSALQYATSPDGPWTMGNLPDGHRCAIRTLEGGDATSRFSQMEARVVEGPSGPVITFQPRQP